ncbi:MAG: heavy metal translocating P-type ATPase [Aggregatilineales bacterium]
MTEQVYKIGNMDCANCAREVEQGVSRLNDVQSVRVDFATGKMWLDGTVTPDSLKRRVESLGKTLLDENTPAEESSVQQGGITGFLSYLLARTETRLAVFGGGLTLATLFLTLLGLSDTLAAIIYTLAMLIVLYPIARNGLNNLLINRAFNINILMSIAAIGAIIIGEYLEASTVIFLFAIGEALEGYTAERARRSLSSLLALKPTQALLIRDNHELSVHVDELRVGDVIRVHAGEQIPMDGIIMKGDSGINQAPITGESLPVMKNTGDDVFAGSINGEGTLLIKVTHLAEDNTLNRIIKLVEEAQSQRAPSQRLIDKFAAAYTPAILVFAALVAFVPPTFFNAPFYDTATETGWLYRALTLLVIGCPCALVISTPVTVISAITSAARRGVLIKGGIYLEALADIGAVAFDKTGTLTQGTPVVIAIHSIDNDDEKLLALAAAIEQQSTHPLAHAIVSEAEKRQLTEAYPVENVRTLTGQGIQGDIAEKTITIGSHAFFDKNYPHDKTLCQQIQQSEDAGQTTMVIHDGESIRGFIAVADAPRPESQAVLNALHNAGLHTAMLTGDNIGVAEAIGAKIGIDEVHAGLLPEDKVTALNKLKSQYGAVAMPGDGINDTPALAAATVGIAMGAAGSAQAMETADVVLMRDDLTQLPFLFKLAKQTRTLIRQNIALTFVVKAIFLLLALFGMTTLWVAVFADVGMSLLVTLNGMRPLRETE